MVGERKANLHFEGSIPALYDRFLVPMIFERYATDLATRLSLLPAGNVLEIAAGTGVVTRELADRLPPAVQITATDLQQAMLDQAADVGTSRPVAWRQADAMQLPFEDGSFDAIVCQFGVMFFPDRHCAFCEMRRVLRTGGWLLFNVWNRIEENEFAHVVTGAVGELFPDNPSTFMADVPHGYYDIDVIQADLTSSGFSIPALFETVDDRSVAATPGVAAIAFCQGTPMRNEIHARDEDGLEAATAHAAAAIERRFGSVDIDGKISALVVTVQAP